MMYGGWHGLNTMDGGWPETDRHMCKKIKICFLFFPDGKESDSSNYMLISNLDFVVRI